MEINQRRQTRYFIACGGFEMKNTASKFTVWCWLAAASFLGGCITLYKGIDKMTNYYYNSEYSSRLVNAYVGGDAYNYIINGTYATAFFVLTAWIFYHNLNLPILMGVERRGSTVIFDGAPIFSLFMRKLKLFPRRWSRRRGRAPASCAEERRRRRRAFRQSQRRASGREGSAPRR